MDLILAAPLAGHMVNLSIHDYSVCDMLCPFMFSGLHRSGRIHVKIFEERSAYIVQSRLIR